MRYLALVLVDNVSFVSFLFPLSLLPRGFIVSDGMNSQELGIDVGESDQVRKE